MNQRLKQSLSLLITFIMLFSVLSPATAAESPPPERVKPFMTSDTQPLNLEDSATYPTYQEAYEAMFALKSKYPEGMTFTNSTPYNLSNSYDWNGGPIKGANGGVGCAAFCFRAQ